MVSESLLNIIMLIEVVLLVITVAGYFLHGLWLRVTARRTEKLSGSAREALARLVTRGQVNVEDMSVLSALPHEVCTLAFLEIATNLSGTGQERLRFIAEKAGLVDRARLLCRDRRWTRRLRGARILSQLDYQDKLVLTLLGDEHPAVRAQAAEWAGAHESPEVVAAMLEHLADSATQARFAVQTSLLRMGSSIAAPLAGFLETHTGRAAEAALRVAESIAEPRFSAAALNLSRNEDGDVRVAAAKLLGAIGGADSAGRLTELLADADPNVRAAAASSLGRMNYWQSASLLAERLRDERWVVRRASGLALRSLGAAGTLLLRKAVRGDDQFAADMAQQVLDLPEAAA